MKSSKPYIYIVDDNVIALKTLQKRITNQFDCHVRTFTTAEECLRMLTLRIPDLVFADYYLDADFKNRMNGDDFLNKAMKIDDSIPVIMYSSTEDFKLAVRLIKAGAQDFIPRNKDFMQEILNTLDEHFNQHKSTSFIDNLLLKLNI